MLLKTYISHWWFMRPRKLKSIAEPADDDLGVVKKAYERLCSVLKIKRHPIIYLVGNLNSKYDQPNGILFYGLFMSVIYLRNTERHMLFYLAHEMFHEYQLEMYPEKLRQMKREESEIEAQGFAVAFSEYMGKDTALNDRKFYLPEKMTHVFFSEETVNSVDDGMPEKVLAKADQYFEKFGFEKMLNE